jgi:uncharacterized membrane protein
LQDIFGIQRDNDNNRHSFFERLEMVNKKNRWASNIFLFLVAFMSFTGCVPAAFLIGLLLAPLYSFATFEHKRNASASRLRRGLLLLAFLAFYVLMAIVSSKVVKEIHAIWCWDIFSGFGYSSF